MTATDKATLKSWINHNSNARLTILQGTESMIVAQYSPV